MYRKYKMGFPAKCKDGAPNGTLAVSTCNRGTISAHDDTLTKEKVRRCWQMIDDTCGDGPGMERREEECNLEVAWRTIRVFVSSTFTDFHCEREILVKKVFPALREWCEEQQLHLVECDLRWGVPKDSTTRATLIACMEEIDRCCHDNDGEPFFLNMLGERYGWVPDVGQIPEDIRARYHWIPGVSVTHMEILHGAYRLDNSSAVFFMRNADFINDLPSSHVKRFVDPAHLPAQQLQTLKEKLIAKFPGQVINYRCQVGGMDSSTGRERVQITGLEKFAEQAMAFLKSAIRRRYGHYKTSVTSMTEEEQETRLHQAMAESKARVVVGRDEELTALLDFSRGEMTSLQWSSTGQKEGKNGEKQESTEENGCRKEDQGCNDSLLCVLGSAGMGKSAVLARAAKVLQQMDVHVVYHHVGCTVSSLTRDNIASRVAASLATQLEGQGNEQQSDADVSPTERLRQVLQRYAATDRRAVLIIDGMDELTDSSVSGDVAWLQDFTSKNIRCIVSASSDHLPVVAALKRLDCHQVELAALDVDSRRLLVEDYFSIYNKRLDKEQLDHLTMHSGAARPLWLAIACEELRLFGDFSTLTREIASLPPQLERLLARVLQRLLREDDTDLMRPLLCVLYCCLAGCPETHVQRLLGDRQTDGQGDGQTDVALLTWVTLRRYLKPFIRMTAHPGTRTVRIQFFHNSMRQAVKENLLSDTKEDRRWHAVLGDYYEYRCKSSVFLMEDLPYHLLEAGYKQRLLEFYRKDPRAIHVPMYYKRLYLNKLRCREIIFAHDAMTGAKTMGLCQFCVHKGRVFGHESFPAKDTCCVCGQLAGARGMAKEAQLCRRHAPFTAPGARQCGVCGQNVMGEMAEKMISAILCNFCNVGALHNKCCRLVVGSC